MRTFKRIAVYCGSSGNVNPEYLAVARSVGVGLAERGIGVVYGGGRLGLMGEVANGALAAGGEVLGVITDKLVGLEAAHPSLSLQHVVRNMHERKWKMAELADAFIALPGGLGTLEEVFEVATWTQLSEHQSEPTKPVGLLEVRGYWHKLVEFLGHAGDEGFIRPMHRDIIQVADSLEGLLDKLVRIELPVLGSWKL